MSPSILALQAFAAEFTSTLYETGFCEVVLDSSLRDALDATEARVAIAYIIGAARAYAVSNRAIADDLPPGTDAKYYRVAVAALAIADGFTMIQMDLEDGSDPSAEIAILRTNLQNLA